LADWRGNSSTLLRPRAGESGCQIQAEQAPGVAHVQPPVGIRRRTPRQPASLHPAYRLELSGIGGKQNQFTDYEKPELWAVRPEGRGDGTATQVAWKVTRDMPSTASLLLADDLLYAVNAQGYALCLEAGTGNTVWKERLPGRHAASPIYGARRLYFFNEKGLTTVLAPGREFKVLATNSLNDTLMATPAVTGDSLIVRTRTHLYRIRE
jgi:hypothetical protein